MNAKDISEKAWMELISADALLSCLKDDISICLDKTQGSNLNLKTAHNRVHIAISRVNAAMTLLKEIQ